MMADPFNPYAPLMPRSPYLDEFTDLMSQALRKKGEPVGHDVPPFSVVGNPGPTPGSFASEMDTPGSGINVPTSVRDFVTGKPMLRKQRSVTHGTGMRDDPYMTRIEDDPTFAPISVEDYEGMPPGARPEWATEEYKKVTAGRDKDKLNEDRQLKVREEKLRSLGMSEDAIKAMAERTSPADPSPTPEEPELAQENSAPDELEFEEPVQEEQESMVPAEVRDYVSEREKKLNKMRALRDISEGGEQIGHGLAGMGGARVGPPGKAEGLRESIAEEEDKITPEEVSMLAKYGIEVPPGMPFSRFQVMFPQIAASIRATDAQAAQDRRANERNAATIEAARLRAGEGKKLSSGEIEQLTMIDKGIANLDAMSRTLTADPDTALGAIGPFDSRVGRLGEKLNMADPKKVEFRRKLQNSLNEYVKAISGAAVPVQEYPRLEKGYLSLTDTDEAFKEKLKNVLSDLKRFRTTMLGNLRKGGRDTTGFQESPSVDEERVSVINPEGKKVQIRASQLDQALQKGYTRA
jgi:hypothetical protein